MWPRRDFIWLCIVFVIVQVAIVSYSLGGSTRAGENLNFAATAVSVILAVIAIVITLVDVAGQKHNVMILQETTEDLQNSLVGVKNLVESTADALESLRETTDEYKLAIQDNVEWRETVLAKLATLAAEASDGRDNKVSVKALEDAITKTRVETDLIYSHSFYLRIVDPDASFNTIHFRDFIRTKLHLSPKRSILRVTTSNKLILNFSLDKEITRSMLNEILMEYPQRIEIIR